jgi:ribosomal protein S18 acetylase RimI-like enzyme
METPQNCIELITIQKYQNIPQKNQIMGYMIFLDDSYLSSIMMLQEMIVEDLKGTNIFQHYSAEFIQSCFKTHGRIIGIIVKGKLIAYRIIYFPKHNDDNLGIDLDFPEKILSKVAHLQMVVVHPDYRGNSLALKMNYQALNVMKTFKYHHACVTVAPNNFYNLKIVFKLGFIIKKLKIKYGNKLRFILHKNLEQELSLNPKYDILIQSTDIDAQQKALQQGLMGYQIHQTGDKFAILFGKFQALNKYFI